MSLHITSDIVAAGAIEGLGYAMLAVGLLLVYRATRVLNFAHAQVGVLGATITAKLVLDTKLPYWLGALAGILVGAALSFAFYHFVVRALEGRPRIVLLVATLGLSQVAVAAGNLLPTIQHSGAYPQAFSGRWVVAGVTVTAADLTMLAVLTAVGLGLALWLARSRYGIALLAASDNADSARLAGIPVQAIAAGVFTAVGALAALTVILYSPVQGVSAGTGQSGQGTTILLMALIASLAGGFWSLPRAAFAGVALGIIEALLYANTSSPGQVSALLFVVLVLTIALTAKKSRLGIDSASIAPATRPIPRALERSRWARPLSWATAAVTIGLAALAPLVITSASGQLTLVQIICYSLAALSVCVITGWAGQITLGQFAFVGIGAYLTAALINNGWNFFAAVGACMVIGAVAAGLLGIPALRVRGMFLAVLTLGFAFAVQAWLLPGPLLNPDGQTLVAAFPPATWGLDLGNLETYYYLCLTILVLVVMMLAGLSRTGAGRAMRAVRDNEIAADALGIWSAATKWKAFVLAGALAALAGALWGVGLGTFQASQFTADASISIVFMVVVGGIATLGGPIVASIGLVGAPVVLGHIVEPLGDQVQNISTLLGGVAALLALRGDPEGIGAGFRKLRERLLRRLADPAPDESGPVVDPAPATPTVASQEQANALQVCEVVVRFGGVTANDRVSLDLRTGQIVGLIGPNGAGKSTLVNAISGALPVAAGRICLGGTDLTRLPAYRRARLGIARTFQNASLYAGLSVSETLALAVAAEKSASFLGSLLSLPPTLRRDARCRAEADALAVRFGLEPWLDSLIKELSTGTRRIVELACVAARSPRVILLDEPAAGVAQREVEQLGTLIRNLQADTGASVLLIEHDLPFVLGVSDRVVALAQGRVIAEAEPSAIQNDPAVIESYLGIDDRAVQRSSSAQ